MASVASSALTGKLENEVEIDASPDKFIHMFTHRPHHVHHTGSSERVQGCDLHEGEFGTAGSIICWKYVHDGKAKTAKELVEAIDTEKNSITLRVLEGDVLEEYKSFLVKIQASPKSDGDGKGSVVHWTLEYERLHDGVGHPETLIPFFAEITRDIDAHLVKEN